MIEPKITQKQLLDIWRNSCEPNFIKWLDQNAQILEKVEIKSLTETKESDILDE